MGSHNFTWSHPAGEVFVTGTFDNWSKSVQLENHNGVFSKSVDLPSATDNVYYKFVVDGNWVTDNDAAGEHDYSGNWNNVLKAHNITPHPTQSSSFSRPPAVGGESYMPTKHMPGAFPPATPMVEAKGFSVAPIPASSGTGNPISLAAGEKVPESSSFNSNTVESTVRDDFTLQRDPKEVERSFGVSPLPATSGASNPISLQPGEQVPSSESYTSNTLGSNVHHDQESYERSDAYPEQSFGVAPLPATSGFSNPISLRPGEQVPSSDSYTSNTIGSNVHHDKESYERSDAYPEQSSQGTSGAFGSSAFDLPHIGGNMIPESSLPMGSGTGIERDAGPFIHSSGAGTSTAELAAQVPREPRGVPEVVRESQQAAHVDPEASASPEAVFEKKEVEQQLKQELPEEPATSEGTAGQYGGYTQGRYGGSTGTYGDEENYGGSTTASTAVPEVVTDSQHQVHASPEASASESAVVHKQEVERELLSEVPEEAPSSTGGASASRAAVPGLVAESQQEAQFDPEASASATAVSKKQDVEEELLEKVPEEPASAESGIFNSTNLSNQATHASHLALEGGAAVLATAAAGVAAVSHGLPASIQNVISSMNTGTGSFFSRSQTTSPTGAEDSTFSHSRTTSPTVPETVEESIARSGESPEATANPEAVAEKAAVEKELLSEVSTTNAHGEHAPLFGSTAPRSGAAESHQYGGSSYGSGSVPAPVEESYEQAYQEPEAAAYPEAVREKSAVEQELLSKVKSTDEAGEPAPSQSAVLSATAPTTSTTHASESYSQTESSQGYIGGSTGETIASYIPGTEANSASREASGSPDYIGGVTGQKIASFVPGTQAYNESKGVSTGQTETSQGHTGSSTGESIASYIPGTSAYNDSKQVSNNQGYENYEQSGSGQGYTAGSTGATIASYIPGTSAYNDSKEVSTSQGSESYGQNGSSQDYIGGSTGKAIASYIPGSDANAEFKGLPSGSATSTGISHAGRDVAALLGIGALAGGAGYTYNESELAKPVETTAASDNTTSRDVTSGSTSFDPFSSDPISAPGGARTVASDRYAVPIHTVAAFRDDPISATQTSTSGVQQSTTSAQDTSSYSQDSYGQGATSSTQNTSFYGQESYGQGATSSAQDTLPYSQDPYGQGATSSAQDTSSYGQESYGQGATAYGQGATSYDTDAFGQDSTGYASTSSTGLASSPSQGTSSIGNAQSGSGLGRDAAIGGAGLMTAAAVAGGASMHQSAPANTTTYSTAPIPSTNSTQTTSSTTAPITSAYQSQASPSTSRTAPQSTGLNQPTAAPAQSTATEISAQPTSASAAPRQSTSGPRQSIPAAPTNTTTPTKTPAAAAASSAMRDAMSTKPRNDSRDVSPFSKGASTTTAGAGAGPSVTTGVASGPTTTRTTGASNAPSAPSAPSTPQKPTGGAVAGPSAGSSPAGASSSRSTPAAKEETKKKRRSFFGKIKEKLRS